MEWTFVEWMNELPNPWWIFLFLMDFLANVLVRRISFPSNTWEMKHVNGKACCHWDYLNNLKNKISKYMLLLEDRTTRLWIMIVKQNYYLLFWPIHHYLIFLLTPRELLYPRTTFLFQSNLVRVKWVTFKSLPRALLCTPSIFLTTYIV